jgi:hypothetical protein
VNTTTTISGSPTTLEAALKVSLDSSGIPVGLAGRFGIDGEHDFHGLKITKLELGAGFGANDAYLYGKAAGKSDVADLEAAVFLGKTCDPDVLTRTDPSVGATLIRAGQASPGSDFGLPSSDKPLYGIYAYGAGAISVNSLIGIPPSCFLNIKAGAGSGYGVFYRGNSLAPVMRQTFSISGEVLCICDIGATLDMTAAVVIAIASAAIAGAFSAWALPAFSKRLGGDADTSFNYVIGFLLLVALPAHAGVLGLRRQEGPPAQGVDKPLLIRVGAWLAAAAAVSGILMLAR